MPVVRTGVGDILDGQLGCMVERIPVVVSGVAAEGAFEVLNILSVVDCLDQQRSQITWWTEADGRPDRVGRMRMVTRMAIDQSRAEGLHLFRIAGWAIAVVADEHVRSAFLRFGVTGVTFVELG
jgi:hypothetical protein